MKGRYGIDTSLLAMAAECSDDLHDGVSGEQTPQGMGVRSDESDAVAGVDRSEFGVGTVAYELGAVGRICEESPQVEQVSFERAVWNACDQLFLSHHEATAAIDAHKRSAK